MLKPTREPISRGLEVIERQPRSPCSNLRLLFVHGISVGAWIWDENFLPYFQSAGYHTFALSLRGHGGSKGHDRISTWNLSDYTDDLRHTAQWVGGQLVVVGHSFGGAIVQNWLRTGGSAAGVALVASVPPWGLAVSTWLMALRSPLLFREVLTLRKRGIRHADPAVLRDGLFSDDFQTDAYTRFLQRVGDVPPHIDAELQGWPPFAPAPWQMPQTFVLAGASDRIIPIGEVWRTALYYGVKPVIIPRLAHTVMLEPRWETAAAALHRWLMKLDALGAARSAIGTFGGALSRYGGSSSAIAAGVERHATEAD